MLKIHNPQQPGESSSRSWESLLTSDCGKDFGEDISSAGLQALQEPGGFWASFLVLSGQALQHWEFPDPDLGSPRLGFPVPQSSAVLVLLPRHTREDVGSAGLWGVRIMEFWERFTLPAFCKALKIISLKLIKLWVGVAELWT